MSRPRKPFGANTPGRLPATMIKVLAAELSDQGRLARGKRYWTDNAVTDIVIGHGSVTAEIQGSRPTPYVVTIEANAGTGVPAKRDVWVRCTCPDDAGSGSQACKHAVAALFALSDEIAVEPELVDRWRRSTSSFAPRSFADHDDTDDTDDTDDDHGDDHGDERRSTRIAASADQRRSADVIELHPRRDPITDQLALLLQAPGGAVAPEIPSPEPIDHGPIRDRLLADVLADALHHLANRWD